MKRHRVRDLSAPLGEPVDDENTHVEDPERNAWRPRGKTFSFPSTPSSSRRMEERTNFEGDPFAGFSSAMLWDRCRLLENFVRGCSDGTTYVVESAGAQATEFSEHLYTYPLALFEWKSIWEVKQMDHDLLWRISEIEWMFRDWLSLGQHADFCPSTRRPYKDPATWKPGPCRCYLAPVARLMEKPFSYEGEEHDER